MLLPTIRNIGVLVLGTLSTFSDVLNAYDLSNRLEPTGPLGVTLDYSLAINWPQPIDPSDSSSRRHWAFSSHLVFKNTVDQITDAQLWQIARDAATEMEADAEQYQISKKRTPNAMGVLAWGNDIILASSQVGQSSFTYDYKSTPVLESLKLCQMVWRDNAPFYSEETHGTHRTKGKCAEQLSAHMYYYITDIPLQIQHARVGVWVRNGKGEWEKRDPCGNPKGDNWGCNLFVADQNLQVLKSDITEEPYDLATLAGGLDKRDQIQLCSSIREDSA
ncbi:hypothetical protein BDW75DRAFT_90837 [Aspergillus navahoensis]